ncbi:MAG TPA: hypothetical protein PK225_12990 [Azonexus sp.]|jgi:hypothetical protein|nr:hypothetical protein [Azonexus sp.]
MGLGLPDVVGAVVLGMVLVGAAVSAVVFFLRLNRKDLDDLEELLETESEEDD